jgi:hypothetical protein
MDPSIRSNFNAGPITSGPSDSAPAPAAWSGDIKLAGAAPQKSKKGLLIGLIILFILVAAGVVAAFFLLPKGQTSQPQKEETELTETQKEFQKLFEVSEALEEYNFSKLITVFIEEDYSKTSSFILEKLAQLNTEENEYSKTYVDNMMAALSEIDEIMIIITDNGCLKDTLEETSKCELPTELLESVRIHKIKITNYYIEAGFAVDAARKLYAEEQQ